MPKNSLLTLTTRDARLWKLALEQTLPYDFYHLPEFHHLAEINGEGKAVMFVLASDQHMIAFPMLLREIEVDGKCYKDAACVHGFVGPLTSPEPIPEEMRIDFLERLNDYFLRENVISAFSRLHPLIDRSGVFDGYGEVVEVGCTLSIDLSIPPDTQRERYRRNHKQDISRLEDMGYRCRRVGSNHLNDFLRIYLDTMDRIQADNMYYFDYAYFEQMMIDMQDVMHLFVCELDGKVASVTLCAFCNGIIQVHLAGTDAEHKKLAPMKLLFDYIRQWGNDIGARLVHLGGGVGAKKDSLYNFKKGFGANEHIYLRWQHIVNAEVYSSLCKTIFPESEEKCDQDFFPEYRNPRYRPGHGQFLTNTTGPVVSNERGGVTNA